MWEFVNKGLGLIWNLFVFLLWVLVCVYIFFVVVKIGFVDFELFVGIIVGSDIVRGFGYVDEFWVGVFNKFVVEDFEVDFIISFNFVCLYVVVRFGV